MQMYIWLFFSFTSSCNCHFYQFMIIESYLKSCNQDLVCSWLDQEMAVMNWIRYLWKILELFKKKMDVQNRLLRNGSYFTYLVVLGICQLFFYLKYYKAVYMCIISGFHRCNILIEPPSCGTGSRLKLWTVSCWLR